MSVQVFEFMSSKMNQVLVLSKSCFVVGSTCEPSKNRFSTRRRATVGPLHYLIFLYAPTLSLAFLPNHRPSSFAPLQPSQASFTLQEGSLFPPLTTAAYCPSLGLVALQVYCRPSPQCKRLFVLARQTVGATLEPVFLAGSRHFCC